MVISMGMQNVAKTSIRVLLIISMVFIVSCKNKKEAHINKLSPIIGTWELISATTILGDSTHYKDLSNKRMIKIINKSHFAFLNHDLNKGQDSLEAFVAGGGTYKLQGNKYVEFLEYCNYREWEKNRFEFNVELKGDTLIQSGIEKIEELGIDQKIIEVYIKTQK